MPLWYATNELRMFEAGIPAFPAGCSNRNFRSFDVPYSTQPQMQRGVYTMPYLSRDGHILLVAVDSRGRFVTQAIVLRGEDKRAVGRMIRNILDQEDPLL